MTTAVGSSCYDWDTLSYYHVDFQHSTMMSPVIQVPFDIIDLIIDIVGENKDTKLLKQLSLVSHSFLQMCSKHLFAAVELHNAAPKVGVASSKKGFVKLLTSRPEVVKYILKLKYKADFNINDDDHLLSPILSNVLPTLSRLNSLSLTHLDWNTLDSSMTSAFLHLMHLPTINHIDLKYIQNFPLSSLTPSVNLHELNIFRLSCGDIIEEDGSPRIVVQLEMMPKIRELYTSGSAVLTSKLLHAKRQDGQPAFNFMDLRLFSTCLDDERNIRYLLEKAKLLEQLHLSVILGQSLVGFHHNILSLSTRTLKVLDLAVSLYDFSLSLPLAGLCEELEALAGDNNILEALSFRVHVNVHETEDFVGAIIQKVENVLVKPGWSALRRVSFKLLLLRCSGKDDDRSVKLSKALQFLPDKYLSHLSKLESVTFYYSVYSV